MADVDILQYKDVTAFLDIQAQYCVTDMFLHKTIYELLNTLSSFQNKLEFIKKQNTLFPWLTVFTNSVFQSMSRSMSFTLFNYS